MLAPARLSTGVLSVGQAPVPGRRRGPGAALAGAAQGPCGQRTPQSAGAIAVAAAALGGAGRWRRGRRGAHQAWRHRRVARAARLPYEGRYDGTKIDEYFDARPLDAVGRCGEIVTRVYSAYSSWTSESLPIEARGGQMRAELAVLGPVFVKIAQTLATRSDIVSKELASELGLLQDSMPTFDTEMALATVREEFGDWTGPLVGERGSAGSEGSEGLFAELSAEPMAAASLAQVYRGRLSDGTDVAVKVQRPRLLERVGLDFYVLRQVLATINRFVGITKSSAIVQGVLDEVGDGIFAELDFTKESEHIERFRDLYSEKCPDVVVPTVIWPRTTTRVLTMTWLSGRKPRALDAQEKLALVRMAAPCLSLQLMDDGFVHCDPHEGNIMLLDDGRLGLIDFGLVTQMTAVHQESMASAILNLVAGDYRALVPCFKGMGVLNTDLDDIRRPGVTRDFAEALEEALSGGGRQRAIQGDTDRRRAFGQLYEELSSLAFQYYFTLPSYYVLVMRSFVTLEGIAFAGDPDFNMYTTSYPYAFRRLLAPRTAVGRQLLRDALLSAEDGRLKFLTALRRGPKRPTGEGDAGGAGAMAGRTIADVLLAREGRELRRVLRDADSAHLVGDLRSPAAAPLRQAAADAIASRMVRIFSWRRRPATSQPSAREARRQGRRRRLVRRILLGHLWRARRKAPSVLVLAAQLSAAVARSLADRRAAPRESGL